jgi:hypothetical protein
MAPLPPVTLYITVRTEQVNGKLAAHNGRLLVHLENYMEVSDTLPPKPKDATLQQYAIQVEADDVNIVMDGGVRKVYLWKGPKISRQFPTLVSVGILPLGTGSASAVPSPAAIALKTLPVDLVREAFNEFPEPVRLAAIINASDPGLLSSLPSATAQLATWADGVLKAYSEQTQGAAAST